MTRPATIVDVAARAGVSPATVSRVLNGTPHPVRPEVRARVLQAARGLGYLPNMVARSLLRRATSAVGLLVPDVSNPYYAVILRGIEDAAWQRGLAVILCNTDRRPERQRAALQMLAERRVDGLVVAGGAFGPADLTVLGGRLPVVAIGRHPARVPSVRVDNVAAGALATRHLLALGHRRIACLVGPAGSTSARDRLTGYRRALRHAGVRVASRYVVPADFTPAGGRRGVERLWAQGPPPTALVAPNDQAAVGAIRALYERGVGVPGDVSVVGFDDTPLAAVTVPALTSVHIPMDELGRRALELLLQLRDGGAGRGVVLRPRLIVRESTAPPSRAMATRGAGSG
ncbi:MAG: LacI family DNA-binding transcriptional regulator [Armatimonadota bacterium]|nr:LacI family DNA-binding transcriptional regulator [Armatimonadota bacterium]MDR7448888.1 LacI family DNA-binding transcriptional regulator [Armatimonadota bacterium]MDR7460141.1 LacI family DNA-binding transcriptional regulator [Armatimonadota bacterium]MDR7479232.1 LacI family DNA-binding transcriptional regulator [Armatimonadota bacterium]MDR7487856.1 LacI family DNA-binding transcriptional regulator [Armatimonadota bacterium]